MSLTLAHSGETRERRAVARGPVRRGPLVEIAFVNNMPDKALRATEQQFRTAIQTAAGAMAVRLHLFALPGMSRSNEAASYLSENYGAFEDLLARSFDAVIVTGNEPHAARLDHEPYWNDLVRLIEWADARTKTSLWSCLAAHAAVFHLHRIERHPLAAKLSGVFACEADICDPLLAGVSRRLLTPHSRLNEVRRDDLVACQYEILSESAEIGVDMFALQRKNRFVFLQGHPEYNTDTLLREYKRDVWRYLCGEFADYPSEPANYFSQEATAVLGAYRRRAVAHRDPGLFDVFPNVASPFAIANRWQHSTTQFYRNWLDSIVAQKTFGAATSR